MLKMIEDTFRLPGGYITLYEKRGNSNTKRVTWHWAGASSQRSSVQVDRLWHGSVFDGVSFLLFFISKLQVFWNRSYRS